MKKVGLMAVLAFLFFSCAKKVYRNRDYSFQEQNFSLKDSKLRTDGVYVLKTIESSEGTKAPESHQFYIFFETGQVNLTVDLHRKINSEADYLQSIEQHLIKSNSKNFKTLFEGYFKVKNDRIAIQKVNVARQIFNYSYGFVEAEKLIIVSKTIAGNGSLDDEHFESNYKETWEFMALNKQRLSQIKPGW